MGIKKETGFTLIELLIGMTIFSIVMAAAFGIYIAYSRTANIQAASVRAQQDVRVGIELMSYDIRMAGYDPLGTAYDSATYVGTGKPTPLPIEVNGANKIRITSDRNKNGAIDDSAFERVSYELSGHDLQRILYEGTGSESPQPLLENVTNLNLTYSGTNNCNVTIRLGVTEPAGMGDPVARELETMVFCRNLIN